MKVLIVFSLIALILISSFANSFEKHPNIFIEANQACCTVSGGTAEVRVAVIIL